MIQDYELSIMKVRSYPGRAVLEDPELILDPDVTRGRAMELLYEASWRECSINWTSESRHSKSDMSSKDDDDADELRRPYANVISQLENVLDGSSSPRDNRSQRSSSEATTDSDCSDLGRSDYQNAKHQNGFVIPRPRLIVPVHTYARRRRTGATTVKRRQNREGIDELLMVLMRCTTFRMT